MPNHFFSSSLLLFFFPNFFFPLEIKGRTFIKAKDKDYIMEGTIKDPRPPLWRGNLRDLVSFYQYMTEQYVQPSRRILNLTNNRRIIFTQISLRRKPTFSCPPKLNLLIESDLQP